MGVGLVLQVNGGDDITINADGPFTFPTPLGNGVDYDVTVLTSPAGETCTVSMGDGTVSGKNVTDVVVTCSTTAYTVSGIVTGLSGGGLVLQLNGRDDLTVNANGRFIFPTPIANGARYDVTVLTNPGGEICDVSLGSGVISDSDVKNVVVSCVTQTFSVGGVVAGLTGAPLVLQLNGGNDLMIMTDGPFIFGAALQDGANYEVTVLSAPPGEACSIDDGMGMIMGEDVTGVEVVCSPIAMDLVGADSTLPAIYGSVDAGTGAFTVISTNLPYNSVVGLAHDPANQRVFGASTDPAATATLLDIDPFFGTATVVGSMGAIGISTITGLAYDADNTVLYGIASGVTEMLCQLFTIDTTTGIGTAVALPFAIGDTQCLGLAYDALNRVLYASTSDDHLITIDPLTGNPTGLVSLDTVGSVDGLGFDRDSNQLHGILNKRTLIRIDPVGGAASPSATVPGFSDINGLTYADDLDTLFGTNIGIIAPSTLLNIDPGFVAEGTRTVGSTGFSIKALANDPMRGVLYGVTAEAGLIFMDQNSGTSRFQGLLSTPGSQAIRSLVFRPSNERLYAFAIEPGPGQNDILIEYNASGSLVKNHGPVITGGGDFEALAVTPDGNMWGILDRGPGTDCELWLVTPTGLVMLVTILTGFDEIRALATNTDTTLYAIDTIGDQLITINRFTGATAVVGPAADIRGMAWITP
jgi:hypothetical protein